MLKIKLNCRVGYLALLLTIMSPAIQPVLATGGELTLQESIELALNNSRIVKVMESDYINAKWRLQEAKAGRYPELSYSFTGSRYKDDMVSEASNSFSNEISLEWPLYTGGRITGLIEQAELNLKKAELELNKVKQQLKLNVTTAYFNLLRTKGALNLVEESVIRVSEHLRQVQIRYKLGNAAKIDQIRVEVEMADTEQERINAKKDYEIAVAILNNLLGRPLSDPIAANQNLTVEKLLFTLENYQRQAEMSRPEVIQAGLALKISEKELQISRSEFYPSVTLKGALDNNGENFPGNANEGWLMSITAEWKFFDSNKSRFRINRAGMEVVKAQTNFKQVRDVVRLEVYQTYLELTAAQNMITTSQTALIKAEEEYQIARFAYEKGFETSLNVLDYQIALSQAKSNYLNSLYEYNVSKAVLLKNAGTL